MHILTSCPSCRKECAIDGDRAHHDGCKPAPPTPADLLFDNFKALVAKIAAPDYQATAHDALNLGALQERIDAFDNAQPRLGEAAVIYAQWGFPVFPLKPRTKVPATKHGFQDATTDVDRIKAYWAANPEANIGLATGHTFDVIDVDLPDGPPQWEAMKGRPDLHGQVSTASGGLHAYILPTGKGNGARICPGVDYRGLGGYVVSPPSWLGDKGHQWTWITNPSPRIIGGAR